MIYLRKQLIIQICKQLCIFLTTIIQHNYSTIVLHRNMKTFKYSSFVVFTPVSCVHKDALSHLYSWYNIQHRLGSARTSQLVQFIIEISMGLKTLRLVQKN